MTCMERFTAIHPLIGKACALAEAMDLTCKKNWSKVEFESDLLVPCKEVLEDGIPSYKAYSFVGGENSVWAE